MNKKIGVVLLQCMNTDTWHNLLIQIGETFSMRFFIKNSVHLKY